MEYSYICSDYHNSCIDVNLRKIIKVLKYTFRIYSIVHSIPVILFKFKDLNKKSTYITLIKKILLSMGFLSWFILVIRSSNCIISGIRGKFDIIGYFIHAILCPLGVLLENTKRIEDYAIFTVPRVVEGFYDFFKKLGYVKPFPFASEILFALSMALFLYLRKYYENEIPSGYLKTLNFIFGKNSLDKRIQLDKEISDKNLDNIRSGVKSL